MASRDLYDILGVTRGATQDEIKQAFRRLAREQHPDVRRDDPHATDRFKEINEAYQVLSDPARRSEYDRFGRVASSASTGDPFDTAGGPFGDLFDFFFGGRPAATRVDRDAPARGADLRYDLELTLEDVAAGAERTIAIPRLETCSSCFGTGAERGATPERCTACGGTGEMRRTQRTVFGTLTQVGPCGRCGGTGTYIAHVCAKCRGAGRVEARREVTVSIPAGVEDGMRLRLKDEGEAGIRGGPRGDLFVVVHVQPHEVYARHGRDLASEVGISMVAAALGDEITLPSLTGEARLEIPPGTQPGATFVLRGHGLPDLHGGRGDLHVTVDVEIPRKLTAEQKALLEEFAAMRRERRQGKRKSVFKKVKDLLQ